MTAGHISGLLGFALYVFLGVAFSVFCAWALRARPRTTVGVTLCMSDVWVGIWGGALVFLFSTSVWAVPEDVYVSGPLLLKQLSRNIAAHPILWTGGLVALGQAIIRMCRAFLRWR